MKTIVLDKDPVARAIWQETCNKYGLECEIASNLTTGVVDILHSMGCVLVVDQSAIVDGDTAYLHRSATDYPACSVVATGKDITLPAAIQLMRSGVAWVLRKELNVDEVDTAMPSVIRKAREGHAALVEHRQFYQLFSEVSDRELSVLKMVLRGIPNKLIAAHLNVSIRTVEARRAKVYRKLNAGTLSELVRRVDRALALQDQFGPFGLERITLETDFPLPQASDSMRALGGQETEPHLRLA